MTGKPGVYLTPEQSVRLAIVDSVDRDKLIAGIVSHLQRAAQPRNTKVWLAGTPKDWYSAEVRG